MLALTKSRFSHFLVSVYNTFKFSSIAKPVPRTLLRSAFNQLPHRLHCQIPSLGFPKGTEYPVLGVSFRVTKDLGKHLAERQGNAVWGASSS